LPPRTLFILFFHGASVNYSRSALISRLLVQTRLWCNPFRRGIL
jgi:hypothetical protein